jgi:Family of unknown function (DUF6252)
MVNINVTKAVLAFALITLTFIGCKKAKDETDECVIATSKLTATINGSDWCANKTLFADDAILITISGIRDDGSTLTLEFDSTEVGTYIIKGDTNHILYTDALAMGYETTSDNTGSLTVTENNKSENRFKANFSVTLRKPATSQSLPVSGSVDVLYID